MNIDHYPYVDDFTDPAKRFYCECDASGHVHTYYTTLEQWFCHVHPTDSYPDVVARLAAERSAEERVTQ